MRLTYSLLLFPLHSFMTVLSSVYLKQVYTTSVLLYVEGLAPYFSASADRGTGARVCARPEVGVAVYTDFCAGDDQVACVLERAGLPCRPGRRPRGAPACDASEPKGACAGPQAGEQEKPTRSYTVGKGDGPDGAPCQLPFLDSPTTTFWFWPPLWTFLGRMIRVYD